MRVRIAAVGRVKDPALRTLIDGYYARLPWAVDEREVDIRQRVSDADRPLREGEQLLAAVPKGAVIVVLDPGGDAAGSEAFARRLGAWRDGGVTDIAFLIGGADGHGPAVRRSATNLLSLGAMTWPHLLVRLMLAEQLYRASTILAGHPYHRA